ncbi:hypothetical protein COU62_01400 [Candidatus Pacearchaeota archaeon CG10_big_fil_rev_8_21_14_0_10_35_219]|nr:hypothetical protein [Candidatus Pacearchaeota archaeon]OIO43379.1 MAG: hypothetical protein AUJ63_00625 [Candidatus Pacearchaeota archaeon CG1_02_35_32]PIO08023.1 MAG: hypothetical protein COU62_01400 [Candidatus Pacearchaeota archaeon CG10_big_fil_rev_8_21_14_0_10_35_219]PIY81535.1 MAG: hypothetical protein COY79_02240 [Candidatus Pacearchaeota archaeon CG_4_10_14_0_8_um_filter_35_169]PIZ78910.1 MAG: hypothetical protein COY00_04625 [Candidatus Pacearchaeota archaeon CG_4_10_14_0_2_um_filt
MRGKRGLQHVEFIVSFVVFVSFLALAFYFFSPVRGDRIVDSTLFYTFDEITDNATVRLATYSLNMDKNLQENVVGIPFPEEAGLGVRAENQDGIVRGSGFDESNVYINRGGDSFFFLFFSEEYPDSGVRGNILSSDNYTVSSSEERYVYSENKILYLKGIYDSDSGYEKLKKEFNLPVRSSFGFVVEFDDGTKISAEKNIPEGLEVFSEDKRIEILKKNGKIEFANLRVIIW